MKVKITGEVYNAEKKLEGIVDMPANEALRLIGLKVAELAASEDEVTQQLKADAVAKGDIVTITAVVNGEKMTEEEKQDALKSAQECDPADCEGCDEETCAKNQEETQQENPYKELPNKDAVKAELDKRNIPYEKNATRPVLEELLLKDDKEKAEAGNEAGGAAE